MEKRFLDVEGNIFLDGFVFCVWVWFLLDVLELCLVLSGGVLRFYK